MNIKNTLLSLLLSISLFACDAPSDSEAENESKDTVSSELKDEKLNEVEMFVKSIEEAHHKEEFNQKEVVQFDLSLAFGGKARFNGTISMTPSGSFVRMEDNLKTIIWDGKQVYLLPDTANTKGARFGVLTWAYFFVAPYKFSDPGANMEILGDGKLYVESLTEEDSIADNVAEYTTGRLTFDQGVGDSPDDWYVVYQDKETNLLAAMAYIVTFGGKEQSKAEENPHAITYEAYTDIDGIPFATQWNFWTWNEKGELSKLLGEATISNIRFEKMADDLFQPAANAKLVEKPAV